MPDIASKIKTFPEVSSSDWEELRCKALNNTQGDLIGEDCNICKNKGVIYFLREGEFFSRKCECTNKRDALRRIEKSGLADTLESCTFDAFKTEQQWQSAIKNMAQDFLKSTGKWFFIGGAVGCGKTHICTAIAGELINQGLDTRYMLWRDEAVLLKGMVNDPRYEGEIGKLKQVPVLYIDDFFKTKKQIKDKNGNWIGGDPTEGDVNLAFELISNRYLRKGAITIISSEKSLDQIMRIDEATGSRIVQRCEKYKIDIHQGEGKNRRLK